MKNHKGIDGWEPVDRKAIAAGLAMFLFVLVVGSLMAIGFAELMGWWL